MALSNSIVRAQDVMVCQLCKSDPKLNWKCLDCNLLMCIKCSAKFHSKFKNAKDHIVLDIKQLGQIGIQKEIDINNVQCKTHDGQTCCLYCSLCKILVCVVCVACDHVGHKFEEIKNVSGEDLSDLLKGLGNVCLGRMNKLQLKVRMQFKTELECCHHIRAGHNGLLWIVDARTTLQHNVLQQVRAQHHKLTLLYTSFIDTKIMDFRILSNGDVLLADKTPTLKIVSTTGKKATSNIYTKSLYIVAVHSTIDNKIVLAARSTEAAFPVRGRRVVIMMDSEGIKQAEWEHDNNNKQMFFCPRFLTCSKDGTIFVVDYLSRNFDGRIVVFNRTGDVVNTYEGHPDINNDDISFQPANIVNTPSDNIIVCEDHINILHYLDNSGNFLSFFDTTNIGIEDPYCLTFMNHETMYIGCTRKNSSDKAKIYAIEFSESQ